MGWIVLRNKGSSYDVRYLRHGGQPVRPTHAEAGRMFGELDRQAVEEWYGLNAAVGCASKEHFNVTTALRS